MKNYPLALFIVFFLVSCLETEFKDPLPTIAATVPVIESMQIEFTSKIESTGLNVTPYKVTINVKTAKDYGLFLAKSTDPQAFYGLNSLDPNLPPAAIIPLVPVSSTDFTYEDTSATLGVVYYYAVLKKVQASVTVTLPNVSDTEGLPPPSQISIPTAPADVYNLSPQVISQTGQKSKIRVNFDPKSYQLYLKTYVNEVEVSEVTISPNSSYYDLNSIDFQKDYKFKLIRKNGLTEIDSSTSSNVAALWPTLNYGSDITFSVVPLANIHEYKIEVKDNTSYGTFYRVYLSNDNVSFNESSYVSESTAVRIFNSNYSAPTTKYVKVSQFDRNDVLMNTSIVYTLTVPTDLYIGAGQVVAGTAYASGGVINLGRLTIYQGQFLLNDQAYTINADEILIETCDILNGQYNLIINADIITSTNCVIQSHLNTSYAAYPAAGLKGGDVKVDTTNAYGSLIIRNKGQSGYQGLTGAAGVEPAVYYHGTCVRPTAVNGYCQGWQYFPALEGDICVNTAQWNYSLFSMPETEIALQTGGSGSAGGSGGPSGNSGRATVWISGINLLNVTFDNGSVAGGAGGFGGSGSLGQKMLPMAGDGSNLIFPPTGRYYCDADYWGYAPRGSSGATGPTGSIGSSGAAGLRCEKYLGDLVQSCY